MAGLLPFPRSLTAHRGERSRLPSDVAYQGQRYPHGYYSTKGERWGRGHFSTVKSPGTAAPLRAKNREIAKGGFRGPAKWEQADPRKACKYRIARNRITLSEGSDGCISTAAFFMEFRVSPRQAARVSCQEDKGWKIKISVVFWPPARSSSAHGAGRQ